MNWFLSVVIIVAFLVIICWGLREHHFVEVYRKENEALKKEKSKLSDSVRQKGTELSGAERKIKRLRNELDEK